MIHIKRRNTPYPRSFEEIERETDLESAPIGTIREVVVFVTACTRCQNAGRDCEVREVGQGCAPCKAHKYGCNHSGHSDREVMTVTRPVPSQPDEEVEEPEPAKKGKQRQVKKGQEKQPESDDSEVQVVDVWKGKKQ